MSHFPDRAEEDEAPTFYPVAQREIPTVSPIRKAVILPPGPGLPAAVGWMVLLVVAQVVFAIPIAVFQLILANGAVDPLLPFAIGTLTTLASAFGVVWHRYGRTATTKLAIVMPGGGQLLLFGLLWIPLMLVLVEGCAWIVDAFRAAGLPEWMIEIDAMQDIVDAARRLGPWSGAVVITVFFGIVPGVGEELFFRGFVGRGLVARSGRTKGVLLTSLLFGAMHIHPLNALFAAAMGVVLHAVYFWTRSLLAPMFLHAAYNTLAMYVNLEMDPNANSHVPPHLAIAALLAVAGILLLLKQSRTRWLNSDESEWSAGFPSAEIPAPESEARSTHGVPGLFAIAVTAVVYLVFVTLLVRELAG